MTTIRHPIRRHEARSEGLCYAHVTLPAVPGVTLDTARQETEPRTKTIRSATKPRNPAGVALRAAAARRVEWVRQACIEAMEAGE